MKPVSAVERFEERYIPEPMSGCWLWVDCVGSHGYGQFSFSPPGKRRENLAHRASWVMFNGDIGDKRVLHKCDVKLCVNPSHLFLGTGKENTWDCINKGRAKNWPLFKSGEKNPISKLCVSDVKEIREMRSLFKLSQTQLANIFGVSPSTVSLVLSRKIWRDA